MQRIEQSKQTIADREGLCDAYLHEIYYLWAASTDPKICPASHWAAFFITRADGLRDFHVLLQSGKRHLKTKQGSVTETCF